MTRAFDPRDILRVRSLQEAGCSLDMEGDVLSGRSPLRRAMSDVFSLGEARTATFLSQPADGSEGLVQTRWRRHRHSAEVVYLSPALGGIPGAAHVWHRTLQRACQCLAEAGAERVFATVDEDDQVALQLFRRLGFAPLTSDTVYALPVGRAERGNGNGSANGAAGTVMDELPEHLSAVRRIVRAATPDQVVAHLERDCCEWDTYPMGGWARPARPGQVLCTDSGAVAAAWRWYAGPGGQWLHVVADPQRDAGAVVGLALAEPALNPGRAVYCAAPGYDAGLHMALRAHDFQVARRRFRLVKHIAVRLIEPAWRELTAEGRLEKAAPQTPSAARVKAAPVELPPPKGS